MAERTFNLPDLGEGLEDAEIVEWKVSEGDVVELNQPLVDVNTAKALVEIPSPFEGTIVKLYGAEGDMVEVGSPLVTFDVEAEAERATGTREAAGVDGAGDVEPEGPKREAVLVGYGVDQGGGAGRRRRLRPPGERNTQPPSPASTMPAPGRVKASPVVRRLARERGIDLAAIGGSGPGGRITREDLTRAARGSVHAADEISAPGAAERLPVRGVRRLIARKMAKAWAEVPHVTSFRSVDATWLEALRRELTEESGIKVSPLPIVVRALVEVCKQHPKLNASFDAEAEEIIQKPWYHVGIATDSAEGLMVPVVRDVDRKGIVGLAGEIAELVRAAREGRATPEQLTGSTITVTNVGTFGSEFGTPIINVPEVAILALGVIEQRPLVVDREIEARPGVTLSLSFDHRIIDGAEAGRAMTDLAGILESPFRLGALPRR